ncbi:MAG: bifunctional 2-polyprenyl-6-hydroxyphenol methylase/3-demethylubiquinol 3-O-methyltransferase UbiG [Zetaproteobacteria bacterium]|nr:MAG: bifunctional 2-polyprenyl-6-hydroxyphenol methylase/3-demethylubiquinol 3-O-methyltransferase UbiG [Zetaproteobacteria bacterium]
MPEQCFDRNEIEKFEAMAEEWWDPNGKFRPLHRINPLRLNYIANHVSLKQARVLDVGCGGGLLAEGMANLGAQVTGIDRSPRALGVARAHASKNELSVEYHESDAESWAKDHAASYDIVTCLEVLEHVPDVQRTVKACADMLKPGGTFFFATLNRTPIAYLKAILGAEYILGWLPKGTHQYAKFIRPSEMHQAIRQAGMIVRDLRGMSYAFLTDRFMLSDDLSVNYLGLAVKPS